MFCQKCRQPLLLDASLDDLNPAAYDVLLSTASPQPSKTKSRSHPPLTPLHAQEQAKRTLYEKVSRSSGPPVYRHGNTPQTRDSAMSFIYLTESQLGHPQQQAPAFAPPPPPLEEHSLALPRRRASSIDTESSGPPKADDMERINRLFEIISARSDIDHPICVECTDLLVESLQARLDAASKQGSAYVKYLRQLQAQQPTQHDIEAQLQALQQAERDKAAAVQQLRKLEQEKDALDEEIVALEQESKQLDQEEHVFWRERNDFASAMADFQAERDSVNAKYKHDADLLEKLQRSNVYNDTFCISHDGSFATINGLRLGRLASKPVDWPEINAAWGHALLLLVTVAHKLNYTFHGYDPQPMGSTSTIIRYDASSTNNSPAASRFTSRASALHHQHQQHPPQPQKKQILELYSSGDMPLGLTFMHRRFDLAMVAFLELVRQLGLHVQHQTEQSGAPLSLPYRIDGERIGDVSIKLGIAQDDGWTKACKLTLTCCKFLLAHASNVSATSRGPAS
ncbi:hypothetical protein CDD82_6442 [Ophiocordyceps australis]|uniref:Autophagy-related protein 6 n=1 Tax=Ophiocordyceps australis TaxID=1399860 RepID=A0A2C5YUY4_9HYPO|nr:hypothetical protein CDD82_6442 [Ophiocordyceps australis]